MSRIDGRYGIRQSSTIDTSQVRGAELRLIPKHRNRELNCVVSRSSGEPVGMHIRALEQDDMLKSRLFFLHMTWLWITLIAILAGLSWTIDSLESVIPPATLAFGGFSAGVQATILYRKFL